MNFRNLLFFAAGVLLITSCAKLRKGSSSVVSPQTEQKITSKVEIKEEPVTTITEPPQPVITVREERVNTIEHTGPDYRFYVIIGSFRVLNNAKNFKAELIREQFTPVILENEKGLYRVSVAAFNDEQAARERISQIRRQHKKYSDVWLLIRLK